MQTKTNIVVASMIAVFASGCANTSMQPSPDPYRNQTQAESYGTIESIVWVGQEGGTNTAGAATIMGGILGAIIGNQVGGGTGRAVATVAGGVGGAVIGNRMENNQTRNYYQIKIRMDRGGHHLVNQPELGNLRNGDRIRIINERAYQL